MAGSLEVQIGFASLERQRFAMSATAFLTQGPSIFDAMKDSCGYRPFLQIPASLHLLRQGGTEDKAELVLGAVHRSRSSGLVCRPSSLKHFKPSDPRDFPYGVASMTTAPSVIESFNESIRRSEHQNRLPTACEELL